MQHTKERTAQRDESTRLTPRQREILQLFAEGKSAKEIATVLNISSRTVEFHKYRIMKDLGIKSAAELVHYAVRHGIITK
jgi:DNA-binding NarL/FixJ family response regulator